MAGIVGTLVRLGGMLLRGAGMVLRGETMGQVMPEEGSIAPSFSISTHDGAILTLDQFRGRKNVVLFFFPKADTPG